MGKPPSMQEGLALFGLPAGQESQRAERLLSLPCCIAAGGARVAPQRCSTLRQAFQFYHSVSFDKNNGSLFN